LQQNVSTLYFSVTVSVFYSFDLKMLAVIINEGYLSIFNDPRVFKVKKKLNTKCKNKNILIFSIFVLPFQPLIQKFLFILKQTCDKQKLS